MPTYSFPSGATATELTGPDVAIRLTTWRLAGFTTATELPAATYRSPSGPLASTPCGALYSSPPTGTVTVPAGASVLPL